MSKPIVNFSVTSDRGTATLEVLVAAKRWIVAVDRAKAAPMRDRAFWPLIHKRQKALTDLEEATRKLLREEVPIPVKNV